MQSVVFEGLVLLGLGVLAGAVYFIAERVHALVTACLALGATLAEALEDDEDDEDDEDALTGKYGRP